MPMVSLNWPMDISLRLDNKLLNQNPIERKMGNIKKIALEKFVNFEKNTCRLMLSRLHGKQNLWWLTDGHWTKCVSSRRSWHSVHFNVGFGAGVGPAATAVNAIPSGGGGGPLPIFTDMPVWDCWASVDVTVVLDTCREPDDRRPLDDPANSFRAIAENWKIF